MLMLCAVLEALGSAVPDMLVERRARDRLASLAARLPAPLSAHLYLECRLSEEAAHTDLILQVLESGREILARENPVLLVGHGDASGAGGWDRLERFCRCWGNPSSELFGAVDSLWLEFDDRGAELAVGALPVPGVFLELSRPLRTASADPAEHSRRLLRHLGTLLNRAPASASSDALARCLRHLPEGARLAYLGSFPERGAALRLCLAGLSGASIPTYLTEVGWAGDPRALWRSLSPLHDAAPVGLLHLDIEDRVLPRVGFEHTFARRPQRNGRIAEQDFLAELVLCGLCTEERRIALESVPGWESAALAHQLWPSVILRRINHVKTVYVAEHLKEAKAYLSLQHAYVARKRSVPHSPRKPGDDHSPPWGHHRGRRHVARITRSPEGVSMNGPEFLRNNALLEAIFEKSKTDGAFRNQLLRAPHSAIHAHFGVRIIDDFRIRFVEKDEDVDALLVLPESGGQERELDDDDLDQVAGGDIGSPPEEYSPW